MSDLQVVVTEAFVESFPGARIGVLGLEDVVNPSVTEALEPHVREVEARLRQRFAGADKSALAGLPAIQAYQRHYRQFGQTYHVLRQLESVALKGKSLASRGALVLAMFAVEVETQLLTAGHDWDALRAPLVLDRSSAGESFVGIGGQEHVLRAGDMLLRDSAGIISAVVYGPDQRTRLKEDETRRAVFTTYVPADIDDHALKAHLEQLADMVRLFAPSAHTAFMHLYPTSA